MSWPDAIADELGDVGCDRSPKRVRVNAICPGLIDTQMYPKDEIKRERGGDGGSLNPLRRVGDPSEIASVAAFLAGPGSSYINGQALIVCGGVIGALPDTPGGAA